MFNVLGYISSIMIDNDIYLLVTEVFGLDIGSSQIAHHRQVKVSKSLS